MKDLINKLYPINACLLGEGYDERLAIVNNELPLEIISVPSGKEFSTWKVPDEWVVRDAWVKFNGKKILSYSKNPLSLVVGSIPFSGKVDKKELEKHLFWNEKQPDKTPYIFKYYDLDWGFCLTKKQLEGLEDGEYEVFIDTEYKPGKMKIGVHTIQGELDKEILLFAHLDHPYQANDNLSGVLCLLELAKSIKSKYTIKFIFCPETIGSIAYAHLCDLSKVEFAVAVDICGNKVLDSNGNDKGVLFLKAFEPESWINRVVHCALQKAGKPYRKAPFRSTIGSDETVFNDPSIGIPSICLSTHPYDEYHTDQDTPDKIDFEKISEMATLITKIVEVAELDYIPERAFKGPLMRSRYGMHSIIPQVNLNYDYFFYMMDGKKTLAELCAELEMNFEQIYQKLEEIIKDGKINRLPNARKERIKKATK